ncbi:reverse transcriptase [Phytophthora megakarya]|uniref:Reverse transcriptase n=1 Tax=Phytophthora megakarya TaxID=4795 RepID=A0A225W816_9STRA|nr:reverse transcriptase [Phytophthora megakarya]
MQSTTNLGDPVQWILDSGSQANICGDLSLFRTIKEDRTSRLDFANGTTEHSTISGTGLLCVDNQVTGTLEDRLLGDVIYTENVKDDIISLGYLQTTGRYKLTCSADQHTFWLSKAGMTLKFEKRANIYRLKMERVAGVMVMAVQKQELDRKRCMELLHQRFRHMSMNTINILATKIDVGVKVNERGLAPYECFACAGSKAKRMTFARVPVRKYLPLEKLMEDICPVNGPTVDGATMFLFVADEATRFKWVYLMMAKSEVTWHIKVLANRLCVRFPEQHVRRLHSDQGGEILGAAEKEVAKEPSEVFKARKRRKRKKNAAEENTDEVSVEGSSAEPSLKRPRRKQKANVSLADYVVGNVLIMGVASIPTTYKQAHASEHWPQWKATILAELQSLKGHETFVPRKTAKNAKAITCCWVFAVERDERDRGKRFKARLRGWDVLQYDVKNAFLYGELEERIFMEQPPGFQVDGQYYICRLLKSLTDSDYSMYVLMENGEIKLLLTVYVDALLLMGPRAKCAKFAALLQENFELTTIVLKRFHMENCNVCATPDATSPSKADVPIMTAYLPYRELVGALQYLSTCDNGLAMNVRMQKDVRIRSYSDADYAPDPVD